MNYRKLLTDVLKDWFSSKKLFRYAGTDGKVEGVIYKGSALYLIPELYRLLNYSHFTEEYEILNIERLLNHSSSDYVQAELTGIIKQYDGKELLEIGNKETSAYIDTTFLKYFERDTIQMYDYFIKDSRNPIYMYNDGELVSMILPVVIR